MGEGLDLVDQCHLVVWNLVALHHAEQFIRVVAVAFLHIAAIDRLKSKLSFDGIGQLPVRMMDADDKWRDPTVHP